MNENQRLIKLITLRRRAMLSMLVISVLVGLGVWSAVNFQWGLSESLLRGAMMVLNVSAFAALAFMAMVLIAIRNLLWALVVTAVALFSVTNGLLVVAIVAIIVVNRLADMSLRKLRDQEAARIAELSNDEEAEDPEEGQPQR